MLSKLALPFVCAALVAVGGCGGGGDTTSMSGPDLAMAPVFKVQSGTYAVSSLTKVSDSCMQNLTDPNNPFTMITVTNDGMGNLSLGDVHTPSGNYPQYNPQAYSQGTGKFLDLYHATTTMMTMVTADSGGCTYSLSRTNTVTVVADNTLNISYMQTQTNHTSVCSPVTVDCTSSYTYTATKQ
jgi:hypothetical protein